MAYFASSASTDVAEWHEEKPLHLMSQNLSINITQAANDAIYAAREVVVTAEHTMESICEELGIHPFHHNFFGKLEGTTLALYTNGHLEIRREGQKNHTSFPVQLIA
jgi:hypothetical protein